MALHLYIHAVEASPEPGKAEKAAERLRFLTPGLGHLVHMPTHIDVRTGKWQKAIDSNQLAITADANYCKVSPRQGFYHLYMAHNHHMLAFAAMMSGQSKLALDSVRTMLAGVPQDWIAVKENAAIADGFLASPLEVMMRFGMWEEILKEPEVPNMFPIARTMRLHARAVAYAGLGKIAEAREEQKKFLQSAEVTPAEATFGNNAASKLFAVATHMLEGEILYREGKLTEAIEQLKAATQQEDLLQYNEPPDWIIPVRHPLGAMLLKDGKAAAAEAVYREDLKRWPNNGWALHGLMKSLQIQGKQKEADMIEKQLNAVWQRADVSLHSSCKCVDGK
jgi:tetratricopeptide (TPR) repeat protein